MRRKRAIIKKENIQNIEKENKFLIIGFLASNSNFYDYVVENYIRKFVNYIDEKELNVKVFLLYDQNHKYPQDLEKNIFINPDINRGYIPGLTTKTIEFFKYINNNYNYKYLFRSNLSSFIVIDRLLEVLNLLPEKEIYTGNVIPSINLKNIMLVSGAGIILSKDYVEFILDNISKYKHFFNKAVDDVLFGLLFQSEKKKIFDLESLLPDTGIKSESKSRYEPLNYKYRGYKRLLNEEELEKIYQDMITGKYYHTRIKNVEKSLANCCIKRQMDKQIFDFLWKKFYIK